jgi:hypothetical protein
MASVRTEGTLALPGAGARSPAGTGEEATAVPSYPAELWARRDVVQLVVLAAVGVVLMGVAWYLSGDGQPLDRQIHRIDLAAGGLLIGVVGGGLYLLRGLRAVAARKAAVKALGERRVAARAPVAAMAAGGELVSGADMTRYHRAGCSLVAGKAVAAAGAAEHIQSGRRPCGLCLRHEGDG